MLEIIKRPELKVIAPLQNEYFFNGEAAMFLLSCMYQAYKTRGYPYDLKIPQGWLCINCNEDFIVLEKLYSTELVIAFIGNLNIINLQTKPGTSTVSTWPLTKEDRKKVRVHSELFGNYLNLMSKYRTLFATIEEQALKRTYQRIYIAGHGTGAPLANYLAFELAPVIGERLSVYTFGSPRIGNAVFAKAYNDYLGDRTFNVINSADLVPTIPWAHLDVETFKKAIKAAGLAITISSALAAILTPAAPLIALFQLAALIGPAIYYLTKVIASPAFKHVGRKYYLTDSLEDRIKTKLHWRSPLCPAKHHDLLESYADPLVMSVMNTGGDHIIYKLFHQGCDFGRQVNTADHYTFLKT